LVFGSDSDGSLFATASFVEHCLMFPRPHLHTPSSAGVRHIDLSPHLPHPAGLGRSAQQWRRQAGRIIVRVVVRIVKRRGHRARTTDVFGHCQGLADALWRTNAGVRIMLCCYRAEPLRVSSSEPKLHQASHFPRCFDVSYAHFRPGLSALVHPFSHARPSLSSFTPLLLLSNPRSPSTSLCCGSFCCRCSTHPKSTFASARA
jgi:hypothetical protein